MGTQDERNNAEPQNEFLSGFRIKDRTVSQTEESRKSSISQTEKGDVGTLPGSYDSSKDSNPYSLTQQMKKNVPDGKISNNTFEKKSGPGLFQKLQSKLFNKGSEPVDAKQKIMVALIPILFVIMVFMFRQVLSKPTKEAQGVESKKESVPVANKESGSNIEWKIPEPLPIKIANSQQTTSDIEPDYTATNIDEGNMYIKSILFSKDKPSVIIGDKIVYLNQEINGAIVVEIGKDYVVFEKDSRRWTQKIAEEVQQDSSEENIK